MKIKKHFTCSIHVTFKKLLSGEWRMLDWQLWRLASLFLAKEQGKQGQEQGRHLPRCPLVSSLLCILSVLPRAPRGAADVGSPALPAEMPTEEVMTTTSHWPSWGRCCHPVVLGLSQPKGDQPTCSQQYEENEKRNREARDYFSRIMSIQTAWGGLLPGRKV